MHPAGRLPRDQPAARGKPEPCRKRRDIRRRLLECPLPADLRFGIVSELAASLPDEEALALLRREKPALRQAAPQRSAEIDALELQILKRRLAGLPPDSELKARTAEEIFEVRSGRPRRPRGLAWYRFQRKEYEEAEKLFAHLNAQDPDNKDYALGLGVMRA